jgi:hypothetical protein
MGDTNLAHGRWGRLSWEIGHVQYAIKRFASILWFHPKARSANESEKMLRDYIARIAEKLLTLREGDTT